MGKDGDTTEKRKGKQLMQRESVLLVAALFVGMLMFVASAGAET